MAIPFRVPVRSPFTNGLVCGGKCQAAGRINRRMHSQTAYIYRLINNLRGALRYIRRTVMHRRAGAGRRCSGRSFVLAFCFRSRLGPGRFRGVERRRPGSRDRQSVLSVVAVLQFLAFRSTHGSARGSVRSVTDPFLLSADGGKSAPAARSADRNNQLALRSGLPRAILDIAPAEAVEDFVRRVESWAELTAALRQVLEAAGFHQHEPRGTGGGFHIAAHVRDDGVLVSWATRQYTSCEPGSFENTTESIMQSALQAVLAACGFAAQAIPEGHDYAGYILVTGQLDRPA